MKLTHRQRDFLEQIQKLQAENEGDPVHYTELAKRLDISNSTAYHMMRVLEEKGCVIAQYQLPKIRIGRSSVVFGVSDAGREFLASLVDTKRQ